MRARRPEGGISLQFAANALKRRGLVTDARRIFKQMRRLGLMEGRHATEDAVKCGLVVEEAGTYQYGDHQESYPRVFLTKAGLELLKKNLWRPHCDIELGIERCVLGL